MHARQGASRTIFFLTILAMAFLTPRPGTADWMTAIPQTGGAGFGTLFGAHYARAGYDADGSETTVTRYGFGTAVSAAALEDMDVYAGATYIFKTSPTDWNNDGSGFILAGGVKGGNWPLGPVALSTYGQLRYTDEDFGRSQASNYLADASAFEVILGGTVRYPFHEAIDLYADLSVYPYANGKLTSSANGSTDKLDWEPSTPVSLALGAVINLDSWKLHTRIDLLYETAIFIGASLTL